MELENCEKSYLWVCQCGLTAVRTTVEQMRRCGTFVLNANRDADESKNVSTKGKHIYI